MIGHTYSCKISKYKYCHVYFVFLFKARPCFAFEKVEKAMSDSSVYCNLCCRVIETINERVLLSKRWKQFDVVSDIIKSLALLKDGSFVWTICAFRSIS